MHARSVVPGYSGIGGPYIDVSVVLRPDNTSQPWEGLQGTDSISPPFLLRPSAGGNAEWAAFYGSSGAMGQRNGLVLSSSLAGPFKRMLPSSLVNFNNGTSEIFSVINIY